MNNTFEWTERRPATDGRLSLRASRVWRNPLSKDDYQELVAEYRLTRRELEVLIAVHDQLSEQQIAQRLRICDRTVHFHLGNLFRRLGVNSRSELILHIFSWYAHVRVPGLLAGASTAVLPAR